MTRKASTLLLILTAIPLSFSRCPLDMENAIMFHIYHTLHNEIETATKGSPIAPAYLAALISLESNPPGNRNSIRFEPYVYQRLLELKYDGKPFGGFSRKRIARYPDRALADFSRSYGLTQIMGYHCIDLGCQVEDLNGPLQLRWAVRYMEVHYGKIAKRRDWESCFRIHNTGDPRGKPARRDYVSQGMARMEYYRRWAKRRGRFF